MNIRKTYALPLMAAAALAAGCSDLDLMPEGNIITEDTKKAARKLRTATLQAQGLPLINYNAK